MGWWRVSAVVWLGRCAQSRSSRNHSASSTAPPTVSAIVSARRERLVRPPTNGASAMNAAPTMRPTMPAQPSAPAILVESSSSGTIEKQSVAAAVTAKPVHSKTSLQRPSTDTRTAARTATTTAASVITVSSTSLTAGTSYGCRSVG